MASEGIRVLFLQVETNWFAAEVGQVETLRRKETLYPAREGPPILLGFLLMGETAVPVLDLGACLGIPEPERKQPGLLVVAATEPLRLAFRADQLEGPYTLAWNEVTLLPQLLRDLQSRPMVWAIARRGETLVPLLDLEHLVAPEEVAVLQELSRRVGTV